MFESPLVRMRRRVGAGMFSVAMFGVVWMMTPGVPVLRGPSAPAELKQAGMELFQHEWEPNDPQAKGDGLGPVFNARSCVACHFQGGVGGGGDNSHNVTAFEALPTQDRPEVKGGPGPSLRGRESVSRRKQGAAQALPDPAQCDRGAGMGARSWSMTSTPFTRRASTRPPLFGAGWIDRISGKTIRNQHLKTSTALVTRELGGDFNGVPAGRPRILPDGRVGKFGWKAQFATLRGVRGSRVCE